MMVEFFPKDKKFVCDFKTFIDAPFTFNSARLPLTKYLRSTGQLEPGKIQTVHSVLKILAAAILSSSIPELCFEHLSIQDIAVSGGTVFKAGSSSDDLGNNSGCLFTNCSSTLSSWRSDDVKNNELRISEIYPNPVNSHACFRVEGEHETLLLVVITDYTGKVCSNNVVRADKGNTIITSDLSNYAQGVYFMKIIEQGSGKIALKKVVKE
jgi:hypothetical protein